MLLLFKEIKRAPYGRDIEGKCHGRWIHLGSHSSVVFVIVGIALVWAIVELVLVLRRTRKTVETLETSVKPIIDDVQKVAADAKEMTASIKPAINRVDPLVERASLAVDAANLEIMRLDGILENV